MKELEQRIHTALVHTFCFASIKRGSKCRLERSWIRLAYNPTYVLSIIMQGNLLIIYWAPFLRTNVCFVHHHAGKFVNYLLSPISKDKCGIPSGFFFVLTWQLSQNNRKNLKLIWWLPNLGCEQLLMCCINNIWRLIFLDIETARNPRRFCLKKKKKLLKWPQKAVVWISCRMNVDRWKLSSTNLNAPRRRGWVWWLDKITFSKLLFAEWHGSDLWKL
jgi:hypothetical protein